LNPSEIAQVLKARVGLVVNSRAAARLYVFLTKQCLPGNVVCTLDVIAETIDVHVRTVRRAVKDLDKNRACPGRKGRERRCLPAR
jgi:hypothetical protein